jgi:hypothetical protein
MKRNILESGMKRQQSIWKDLKNNQILLRSFSLSVEGNMSAEQTLNLATRFMPTADRPTNYKCDTSSDSS